MKYPELKPQLNYFEILFADNGIGFDKKYKEKIFEIFQRLHSHEGYLGTGIGLALCRKIVQNHNGLIFAESREQAGALFHIILPLDDHHTKFDLLPEYTESEDQIKEYVRVYFLDLNGAKLDFCKVTLSCFFYFYGKEHYT